jgi:membrane protease subunit HflC
MRHTVSRTTSIAVVLLLLLAGPLVHTLCYTVNERELAVVLQFGQPVVARTTPGLYFKLPLVQEVTRLPKTFQFWIGNENESLVDLPTADGKKIDVTPWAAWRISDPVRFLEVLRTVENAQSRVQAFVRGAVRNAVTSYNLSNIVRSTNRKLTYSFQVEAPEFGHANPPGDAVKPAPAPGPAESQDEVTLGRKELIAQILKKVHAELSAGGEEGKQGRGIELVDVGISRIEFVAVVREAAFSRLTAFMQSIASRYTSEGERHKQEILNRTDAEVQKLLGEGTEEASSIRGKVDAEIIDVYAKAITRTGEFYNFIRTLEAYEASLAGQTRLILSTDSPFLSLLRANVLEPVPPKK